MCTIVASEPSKRVLGIILQHAMARISTIKQMNFRRQTIKAQLA